MDLDKIINDLIIQLEHKNIVVFTGAGMSTASGIKDFRGENGLYKENINAETILSHSYFMNNPKEFYKFFREKLINENANPNEAHRLITELEKKGYINSVITQNIDNLDRKSGTKNVIELHGNAENFHCIKCKKKYKLEDIIKMDLVPKCECGNIIRPDIVLYEEPLENFDLMHAKEEIKKAKTLLVMGSSLKVTPAALLVHDFIVDMTFDKSKKIFIINKGKTDYDGFVKETKYDGDIIDFTKKLKNKIKL
jgi:NAD-dependent deacetylase